MAWTSSRELDEQALLEINRLRDEVTRAHELERRRLTNKHAAAGTARSGQFLAEVQQDIEKRLLTFASDLTQTLVDLARFTDAPIGDLANWVVRLFDSYFVSTAMSFAPSTIQAIKGLAIDDSVIWTHINDLIDRARRDRDITLGRLKLQTPRTKQSADTAIPKPLSELPTREALNTDLNAFLASGSGCSILFMDLDGFKKVNDTRGHAEGDRCLEIVATVMQSALSHKGAIYRYGGDEFVALLRNFDISETAATGERVRGAIMAANPGVDLPVSVSVGVASSDQLDVRNAQALLGAGDQAMYMSKNSGGNRVTRAFGEPQEGQSHESSHGLTTERVKRLVDLTEFAVHRLLNDPQNDSAHGLAARVAAWEAEVLATLDECEASEVDKSWFRVLSTFHAAGLDGATREHVKIRNELAERIERFRDITRRIEEQLRVKRR